MAMGMVKAILNVIFVLYFASRMPYIYVSLQLGGDILFFPGPFVQPFLRQSVHGHTSFLLSILGIIYCKAFIFHIVIGLYEDMIPIDFGFSKLKVVQTYFCIFNLDFLFLPQTLLKCIWSRYFVSATPLTVLG